MKYQVKMYPILTKLFEEKFYKGFDMKIMEPSYQYFLELRKTEGGAFYSSIGNQIKLKKRRALVSQFY